MSLEGEREHRQGGVYFDFLFFASTGAPLAPLGPQSEEERQTDFFSLLSAGGDIIYPPHLIAAHPHAGKRIRPTHVEHKGLRTNLKPKNSPV